MKNGNYEVSEISGLRKAPVGQIAGGLTGATKPGGFQKVDVLVMSKTDVSKSGGGGSKNGACPTDDHLRFDHSWTMTDDDEYLGALVRQWRKEKGFMSFAWLKLLVWLFALDQPAGSSKRGLTMTWLSIKWACLILDCQRLKLIARNFFAKGW